VFVVSHSATPPRVVDSLLSAMSAPAPASSGAASTAPAYALYRASALGKALQESLTEMYNENEISRDQVISTLLAFDRSFNEKLAERQPQNKITMEGRLSVYRYCDNVWSLNLLQSRLIGEDGTITSPHIRIIACEAKKSTGRRGGKK